MYQESPDIQETQDYPNIDSRIPTKENKNISKVLQSPETQKCFITENRQNKETNTYMKEERELLVPIIQEEKTKENLRKQEIS